MLAGAVFFCPLSTLFASNRISTGKCSHTQYACFHIDAFLCVPVSLAINILCCWLIVGCDFLLCLFFLVGSSQFLQWFGVNKFPWNLIIHSSAEFTNAISAHTHTNERQLCELTEARCTRFLLTMFTVYSRHHSCASQQTCIIANASESISIV